MRRHTALLTATAFCALGGTSLSAQTAPSVLGAGGKATLPSVDAAPPAAQIVPNGQEASPKPGVGVEEIVVTAQRRSENLQTVPIAITAITSSRLAAIGVTGTDQLFQVVPALTLINSSGFQEPRIRGVGNSSAGPTVEASVSTYVDGVYISSAPGSLLSLNNVERVEILKGPQGTLFGRNATGGLIQIITKDPSSVFGGNATVSYGNYKTIRGDAYVTGPVAGGVNTDLALSINHTGDGYGTNLFDGHETYKTFHDFAARSKTIFEIGPATTARLAFDYEDTKSSDPSYRAAPGSFSSAYPLQTPDYGPRDSLLNEDPLHSLKAGGVSLKVDHNLGDVTLTSITAYRRTHFTQAFDADFSPLPVSFETYNQDDAQFSQEGQISGHEGRLRWVAGVYYFHLIGKYDPLQFALGPSTNRSYTDSYVYATAESIAGYAQATYEIFPATNFTAGFRYTDEKRALEGDLTSTSAAGVVKVAPYTDGRTKSDVPTWRFALDHKFGEDVLGYISYNRGFKSGGFNPASPNSLPYKPEYIDAYEGGIKSELFDRHLRLNVAGYYYNYRDIQVNTFLGTLGVIYNGAKAEIYGLDADLDFRVSQNLSFTGGLSLIHDRFTNFPLAVIASLLPNGHATTAPGSATGNRLPFTPDAQINLGVDYKHDLVGGQADFSLNNQFSTGYFIQPDNFLHQRRYDMLNGSITFRPKASTLSIAVYGNNLLNENVIAFGNISASNTNLSLQAPRTYGIRVGVKF